MRLCLQWQEESGGWLGRKTGEEEEKGKNNLKGPGHNKEDEGQKRFDYSSFLMGSLLMTPIESASLIKPHV